MHSVKPEHNFAKVIFGVQLLRPQLCVTMGARAGRAGGNDLLPLISNLSPPESSVRAGHLCVGLMDLW